MPPIVAERTKAEAIALTNSGLSTREVAARLGVGPTSVSDWSNGKNITPDVLAMADSVSRDMAAAYEGIAWQVIGKITAEDIAGASLLEKVKSATLSTDKMRLLRDQSTANVSNAIRVVYDRGSIKRELDAPDEVGVDDNTMPE